MKKLLWLLLCASLVGLASCGKKDPVPDPVTPPAQNEDDQTGGQEEAGEQLVVAPDQQLNPELPEEGGTATVRFTAQSNWTVEIFDTRAAVDWVTVSPASGGPGDCTITIRVEANETTEERIIYIRIIAGDTIIEITISQQASEKQPFPTDMEAMFPDPLFREYVLTNFDTDGDGLISEAEALAVTNIDVKGIYEDWIDGKGIATLQGVEYFTNLTELDCSYNQLTALDVSQNTVLTNLTCSHNQLTALDVSQNTALTELVCSYNQLMELDVSQNTVLTNLVCSYNQLTALDVSKNTELIWLSCNSNRLTELDVSQNTALAWLQCNSNQLTELDVCQNTALTLLYCYSNQLTTLDVSQNTALIQLDCSYNQLTALDVSKNTRLGILKCYDNQLTTLDVSKTDLENSSSSLPLDCAPMETLQILYLKTGWSIPGITEDSDRNSDYIPDQTEIVFVD